MGPRAAGESVARTQAAPQLGWIDPRQHGRPHDPAVRLYQAARPPVQQGVLDREYRPDVLTPRRQNSCNGLAGCLFCPARPIAYLPFPSLCDCDAVGLWIPGAGGGIITTAIATTR